MQVCHGKVAPLKRLQPGEAVIYYSPSERLGGGERLRAFTALGRVCECGPYQVSMGADFNPFRREITWCEGREAPIAPLLDRLSFTAGQRNWGAKFRFGLFQIPESDLVFIAEAMGVAGMNLDDPGGGSQPRFRSGRLPQTTLRIP